MSAMSPVPKDHPLMLAWEVHKKTEEYANSRNWAANPQHVDGSLWALFSAGWQAAQPAQSVDDGTYEAIGKAFREVLSDPAVAWRDTGAKEFIARVGILTAALQEKGNG